MTIIKNIQIAGMAMLVFSTMAYAAKPFEGDLTMKIAVGSDDHTMSYVMKGSKLKTTLDGEKGTTMIIDLETNNTITLMPEEKQYMEITVPKAMVDRTVEKNASGELKKTGRSKKILGYTAYEWSYEDEDNAGTAWIVPDYSFFATPSLAGRKGTSLPERFKNADGLPFEVNGVSKKDKRTFQLNVTAIKPRSVAASELAPPAGYTKIMIPDLGNFMK